MYMYIWYMFACHHSPNISRTEVFEDCPLRMEDEGNLSQHLSYFATSEFRKHDHHGHNHFGVSSSIDEDETGVLMLEHGLDSLLLRGWLAAQAEHTIDIQYFIFSADNVGLLSIEALLSAAERGVYVRVMVDDVLAHGDENILRDLHQHQNIDVKVYNPNINIGKRLTEKSKNLVTQFDDINQRMHHKTFIVDGKVVITGGRNVGDEYYDLNSDYNFRDRDVALFGGTTRSLQQGFDLFWNDEHAVPISELMKSVTLDRAMRSWQNLHYYACNPKNFSPAFRNRMAAMPGYIEEAMKNDRFHWVDTVRYVSDAPWKNETDGLGGGSITTRELLDLLSQARSRIWIQTPYLILTEVGLSALQSALDKGVEIKILTNSLAATDNYPAFAGYKEVRNTLRDMGVNVYEMKPDAIDVQAMNSTGLADKMDADVGLHSKSMLIDNHISVVGTFNMDPRSANLNTESFVVIVDAEVNEQMAFYFEQEMNERNSWPAARRNDREASVVRRLITWISKLVPTALL